VNVDADPEPDRGGSRRVLGLAARGRPGQYPTFLFFGAVHHLLLRGADHALARYFPSIVGAQALPAAGAGPALVSFCETFGPELAETGTAARW
jgi:hypothetical protein